MNTLDKYFDLIHYLYFTGKFLVIIEKREGESMYVGCAKQMKYYDELLLKEGYSIIELVDKASDAIMKHIPDFNHMLICCGSGNNGADGLAVAYKLRKLNKKVDVILLESKQYSIANTYYQKLLENIYHMKDQSMLLSQCDLIIDAMFGFGFHGTLSDEITDFIQKLNHSKKDIIAIDIPSGLDCDYGTVNPCAVIAKKTISLSAMKQCFLNEEALFYTGEIIQTYLDVKDMSEQAGLSYMIDKAWVRKHLKPREYYGHKGTYGKVLHITGCKNYRGAAILAAKASVYSGSGVVCVCSKEEVNQALSISVSECTTKVREHNLLIDYSNYDAILIGSGLGLDQEAYTYVEDVLRKYTGTLVIDGDALRIVSKRKELLKESKATIILTPHVKEFDRLCPGNETSRIEASVSFAKEFHCIVVLKGPHTRITDGTKMLCNTIAHKAMATAGMGDVLAGMICAFAGQGYCAMDASALGVYLHGACGHHIGNNAYTVLPSKLIEQIPYIMNKHIN